MTSVPQLFADDLLEKPRRFDTKVVTIIVSVGGIGRSIANPFAADGAIVLVVDVNSEGGTEIVRQIRKSATPRNLCQIFV